MKTFVQTKFDTDIFLWIWGNFQEQPFYGTPSKQMRMFTNLETLQKGLKIFLHRVYLTRENHNENNKSLETNWLE